MVVVIDYGMGNLGSIMNMMRRLDIPARLTRDAAQIEDADRVILPGVGSFDQGMRAIDSFGLRKSLDRVALERRRPVLGVCLGMQLIALNSEEGGEKGLGWIDAQVRRFNPLPEADGRLARVPHMGWNYVSAPSEHSLFAGTGEDTRFYFVHSYYVECRRSEDVAAVSWYGGAFFAAGIVSGNIAGVQFHPEKSHHFGMQLYRNFAAWEPEASG